MERRTITFSDGVKAGIRLESAYWQSLEDIADREGMELSELIEFLRARSVGVPLARICRVYAVDYYRDAARGVGDLEDALFAVAGVDSESGAGGGLFGTEIRYHA